MTPEEFKPLMPVKWKSTSNGTTTVKRGVCLAIRSDAKHGVPKGAIPIKVYPDLEAVTSGANKLGGGKYGASNNDRVLVRCDRLDKNGSPLTPWFYAPRMSVVEVVVTHETKS